MYTVYPGLVSCKFMNFFFTCYIEHWPKNLDSNHIQCSSNVVGFFKTQSTLDVSPCFTFFFHIRKYGSTFYIGIAMVVLPYFGPWKFEFSLSVSTQFDFYQHQGGEHVES